MRTMTNPIYCTATELAELPGFMGDKGIQLPHVAIPGRGTFFPNVFLARVHWTQEHDDDFDMERRSSIDTELVEGFTFFRFLERQVV